MFDRAQPSKRAKTWRADPGLLSGNSSRGFAATRWGDGEDGFMVDDIKRTKDGFALDEYAQVPLSPQAIRALKQLQALEPEENDSIYVDDAEAPEKFQVETWNANAHLPFVVDAYAYDDDLGAQTQTTPDSVVDTADVNGADVPAHHAEASAEIAENSDASHTLPADDAKEPSDVQANTAAGLSDELPADATAQSQQEHLAEAQTEAETEAETESENEAQAQAQAQADADAEAEAVSQALAETTQAATETPADAAEETQALEATVATDTTNATNATDTTDAEDAEDANAAASQAAETTPDVSTEAEWAESELTDENTVAPEQMAASLDEVVDDVTLPEPVLSGIDPEVVAQREAEKFSEGLAQGIAQGERQARDAMQQEVQAQCTVLANVTHELHALLKDSKAFYEPLKRLALHLAEQIVVSELRTSTHAIEQLIQRCLDELDHPAQGLVVLELNPEDKARLQAQSPELIQGMRLEAVQDMQPGSVRLFANDTVVEDLVEHRLQALAQSMLVDVATWQAKSALAKPAASAQDLESEDVHP